MSDNRVEKDDLRLCPVCRMPISILATKCRHCGAAVGRPRKEVERLTIKDLGGESVGTYTLPTNVVEALETFRAEESSSIETQRQEQEQARGRFLGRRGNAEQTAGASSNLAKDLPQLDSAHAALVAREDEQQPTTKAAARPRPQEVSRKIFLVAAIAAGLVLLYVTGDFAWARIKGYLDSRNKGDAVTYQSRALEMLASGQSMVKAHQEAVEAVRVDPSAENQKILDEVRKRLGKKVEALLLENPFRRETLNQASFIASKAADIDADASITALKHRVNIEMASYSLILSKVDKVAKTATFKLHVPGYPKMEETVEVGDYVQERFIVRNITSSRVRLEDTKVPSERGHRMLSAPLLSQVTGE